MQSLTPSSAPPKDAPPTLTAAPSLDAVSFETVLLNFWIESAFDVAKKAFGTDKLQTELTSLTERHVLRHIRNVLKDTDGELVEAVVANISTVSLLYPWQNDTILATHTVTGAVRFYPSEQGPPRNEGVNAMVHNSFRSRGLLRFLIDFGEATDETLQQVYAIHVGLPSDVLPTVATTTKTDSDKTTTAEQDKSLKSKMKDEMEDWVGLVDWGNWEALSFILFVSISGFLFLLCSTCIFGIGCRRRRRIRREKMFAEIHGTNSSTDTEALTPATEHEKDSEKPNGNSQTTLPEKDPYDAYFTHPVVTVGYPLLSGSMDAHDAAMEQCSLADGTVDAIVLSRMKNHDIDDDMASSLSNGSVGRSDVTSVYSYIENKSMMLDDDPNFSFGAAIATNPTGSADDDISTGWSVPGVNTTGMSYAYGLDTNMGLTSRVSPETPTKDDMANPSDTSLRGVSTSASTHEGSNLLIFCDGTADDSLSLINDSVILSALDNFNDDFDNGPTIPSIGEKMTTNSRVAAVVANLEAKLDSSTDSQMAKSLEGKGKSLNYSGITDARTPPNDKTSSQPDRRSPSSSVVSRRVSDEGDRSAAESVSLASYTAAPYKNDRKSIMPKAEVETEPTVVLDTIDKAGHANPTLGKPSSMPPKARAQSDGLTPANDADSEDVAQQKSRGRSVSPVKAVARPSWGVPKPSSDAIPPRNRSQYLHQQQVESTAKALAFWNKSSSGRSSKASQQALNALNTPSKFPDFSPPFTESRASPYHRSPEPDIVNQSYQESESDIQSICSYDDRSQFSFAKRSVAPDSSHHNALGNNTTSLLGSRLPSSSMDGSEEYNLQSANQ